LEDVVEEAEGLDLLVPLQLSRAGEGQFRVSKASTFGGE
jgi:hypothetical protein